MPCPKNDMSKKDQVRNMSCPKKSRAKNVMSEKDESKKCMPVVVSHTSQVTYGVVGYAKVRGGSDGHSSISDLPR